MIQLPLVTGEIALLDDADSALVAYSWSLSEGYARRHTRVQGRARCIYLHREVLGLQHGDARQVDHKNRDRLDCRRSNLRVATNAENSQNRPAKSGYRGVHFNKATGKWVARVKLDYRHRCLGSFDNEVDAAHAAEAFRRAHLPFAIPDELLESVGSCVCRDCRSEPWDLAA